MWVRIGSVVILHLSASQVLHTVMILLVRLQGKFDIAHPYQWKGYCNWLIDQDTDVVFKVHFNPLNTQD